MIETSKNESRRDWILERLRLHARGNSRNSVYQFWRNDNHPVELIDNQMIEQRIDYIHDNPLKARIVEKSEDYLMSSAGDYNETRKGVVHVECIY